MECDKIWNSLDWFNPSSTLSCVDNAPVSSGPMRWLSSLLTDQSEARIARPHESQHLRTLLTWHAADMRSWRAELRVSAVFSHSRDKSSCEERIWEIWENCQEQRIRNMWKTTAQLRYHYGDCNTGLILVNSINSRLLTLRYLHFFTSKIPVSALCSYAQTNISPYLDLARLRPEQIEIFIWAYLHTAYAELWGGGGDAGRVG